MKTTKTHYLYWTPSNYSDEGYRYCIFTSKFEDDPNYIFVSALELLELDIDEVKEVRADLFDKQIDDLRVQIVQIQEKKQQLLAIGHEQL